MVILIGGASCTGKTTMAQRLLEKYHMPYLSIDHLKMGLVRGSRYCDFTAEDPDDEITEKLWPIIRGIIMTNIENDQNIIIEGCYLPSDRVLDFEEEYRRHITAFYIGFSEQYIQNKFDSNILTHRSETEYKEIDDYMNQKNFIDAHNKQKARCNKENKVYFEITSDYELELKKAYTWLEEQIEEKKLIKYN
jgi:putative acetyltransferase